MSPISVLFLFYFAVLNLAATVVTCADKRRSRERAWRVPERTLLLLGFLGGAAGEFMTMLLIRHKTRKPAFMILLPLFIFLHAAAVFGVYWLFSGKVR